MISSLATPTIIMLAAPTSSHYNQVNTPAMRSFEGARARIRINLRQFGELFVWSCHRDQDSDLFRN